MPGIDMPKALSRALQLKFNKFVVIFLNLPLDKSHYISDFRSLYLHFECGVWMYNSKAVLQIKKDYFDTLNECTQITLEECIERLPIRVFQEILRIFAPLM